MRLEADRVRDCDAWDVAREFVQLLRVVVRPVALYVLPDGGVAWSIGGNPDPQMIANRALSLVGVYTQSTSVEAVHDDIIAMQRGREGSA